MHTDDRLIDKAIRMQSGLLSAELLHRLSKIAGALAVLAAIAVTVIYSVTKPDNNWDMIPYIATAIENRYPDATALHEETWRQVAAVTTPDEINALKYAGDYRRAQWESPNNFQSQLIMYRVKIGYVQMLRLIEPYTGLVLGGHLISLAAAIASGLIILAILACYNALQAGLLVGPALLLAGFGPMTSAVFPDIVLAAFSFAAIFALLKKRDWLASVLLVLSFTIRPDNIIMIFALLIAAVLFGWRKLPLLTAFVACLIIGLVISSRAGHPGWWAHLYFTCIQMQNSMSGFKPDFSLLLLIKAYIRGVILALYLESWPSMLLVSLVAWAAMARAGIKTTIPRLNGIVFAMFIGMLGKFVYFPMPYDRFFFNMIIIMVLMLSLAWAADTNRKAALEAAEHRPM
ncbi:hypothetical protein CQ052_10470 [Ochrobactrum sp. MYb15]|uniref:hypothetical protein n=1 Tax=Brucella TaxID=234 RepID=UPI0004658001|nr:hypothetical protein [Brucella rhizosphaerae]PQZ48830.1 hypothetical protein CQZ90_09715 [Ochrobactrum sp. MYb19]PRA67352.1 hypothetical protein CQ053_08615 [Ochrobactrum sp. MYb18]PRA77688.1 hypothetical protein CQ049_10470 [Brucella thiophenivorans]PRA92362.1 hypothetical protein CQ051_09625 [Ochrobactrum sp. MYb14]PRA99698.1 hypothetical protein CQ052_10470 [Ochrobactrum sp. MYb15]